MVLKHPLLIFLLASLAMMGALSIDAYLPALPTIAREFHCTLAAVQQTLTIYLVAYAGATLFQGTLSDSFGRRPVVLSSLLLYCVGTVGAGLAPDLGWLLFFRFSQGLSAGAGGVVGRAMVGDLFSGAEAQRAIAYISTIFGLAPAIAPILGGWLLAEWGWRAIFFAIALVTLTLWGMCLRWLPESLPRAERHPFHFQVIVRHYWEVGCHVRFLLRCFAVVLCFSGVLVYVASAPAYVLNILHLTVKDFGWLFLPMIGGMMTGSLLCSRLSHRVAPESTIRIGFAIMAVAALVDLVVAIYFVPRVPWAVMPKFFYGLGVSLATPAMVVRLLDTFPKVRGLSSALQTAAFMLVFSVGSGVICPLLFGSAARLAWGALGGLGLGAACWWLAGPTPKKEFVAKAVAPTRVCHNTLPGFNYPQDHDRRP